MTRLKEKVPQMEILGSSNAHHLSNTMMHAVTAADPDVQQGLTDLWYDIGGAKGKGLKKRNECMAVARSIGVEFKPIKRFVSTRFRTLRICIHPVLHNFIALVKYYKSLKKPTPRQKRLQAYFVERCDMTRLKLKFAYAATAELSNAIDFFEQNKVQVHNFQEKMEEILRSELRKCVKEEIVSNLDEETNEISKKSGRELLNIKVEGDNILKNTHIFIGQEVEKEIRALGLSPYSKQLNWFFEMVRTFHSTKIIFLKKYFEIAIKSSALNNTSALSPYKQSHESTPRKLKALADQYSKAGAYICLKWKGPKLGG